MNHKTIKDKQSSLSIYQQIQELARIGASKRTIAIVCGFNENCFQVASERYIKDQEARIAQLPKDEQTKTHKFTNPFEEAYFIGFENLKIDLLRAQHKSAFGGNAIMLQWLGKNELGQSDKRSISLDADDRKIELVIRNEKDTERLKDLERGIKVEEASGGERTPREEERDDVAQPQTEQNAIKGDGGSSEWR